MFTDNTTQIFNVIIRFLFLKYHYLYPEEKNCLELKIGHFNAAQKKNIRILNLLLRITCLDIIK